MKSNAFNMNLCEYEKEEIINDGLRMSDMAELIPVQGRRKNIVLNRVLLSIELEKRDDLDIKSTSILVPCLEKKRASFALELLPMLENSLIEEHGRYFLRSMSSMPFKINGVFSTGSFLMRGDQVDLGFFRFVFAKLKGSQSECLVNEEISRSNLNLVFVGETGTGKTHLAKKYHEHSGRLGSFVHLNLSNLSPQLVESELFGHRKGAFTGAHCDKMGAIREAHHGTLFLDEIDSLSLEIQTKLLLFLEDRKVRPVGGHQSFDCDVRLIFASGKKLEDCLVSKKMRPDFYFRMTTGVVIPLRSLREQPELIESLCNDMALEKDIVFSSRLVDQYKKLSWPGNIRQLRSHLYKKIILSSRRRIEWCALDNELIDQSCNHEESVDLDHFLTLEEYKRRYCQRTFFRFGGSVKRTARALGIAQNTLRSMITDKAA
jgi:transcriptional regulator of acetoin/glycerol metabolism